MADRSRPRRQGFGFYLFCSLALHLVVLWGVSDLKILETPGRSVEVIPAKVAVRNPIEPAGNFRFRSGDFAEIIAPDPETRLAALRQHTRLSPVLNGSNNFSSEKPGRVTFTEVAAKPVVEPYREFSPQFDLTPPSLLSRLESKDSPAEGRREVAVREPEETKIDGELMLPGQKPVRQARVKIKSRPPFPYGKLGDELPAEDLKLTFEITLSKNGSVRGVTPKNTGGNPGLAGELSGWVKSWKYRPLPRATTVNVTVEIPGGNSRS